MRYTFCLCFCYWLLKLWQHQTDFGEGAVAFLAWVRYAIKAQQVNNLTRMLLEMLMYLLRGGP
jgi:hypothetical protein